MIYKRGHLKRCPRCGGKAAIGEWPGGWGCYDITKYFGHCTKRLCYVMGPIRRTKAQADKAWNEPWNKRKAKR